MTSRFMRRTLGLLLLVGSFASPARAQILWYNGNYDGRTSLLNESNVPAANIVNPPLQTSLVYENFVVPTNQIWIVSSVFSNDLVDYPYAPVTSATWQIRAGVSSGNGGTLIAGGDTSASVTPLSGISVPGGFVAETVTASLSSVVLYAGTYWVAVAPDSAGYYGDSAYVLTTSGAGAIGTPKGNDGNSYITNTYPPVGSTGAYSFTPTTTALNKRGTNYGANIDFSIGVQGIVVPEPSTLAMMIGAAALTGPLVWWKRRAARSS